MHSYRYISLENTVGRRKSNFFSVKHELFTCETWLIPIREDGFYFWVDEFGNLYIVHVLVCCMDARFVDNGVVGVLQCVAVCCSMLQCVAACCSVLQYVAVCCMDVRFVDNEITQQRWIEPNTQKITLNTQRECTMKSHSDVEQSRIPRRLQWRTLNTQKVTQKYTTRMYNENTQWFCVEASTTVLNTATLNRGRYVQDSGRCVFKVIWVCIMSLTCKAECREIRGAHCRQLIGVDDNE